MSTDTQHRTAVVLSAVAGAWLTTTDIHSDLVTHGFPWSPSVTRETLHFLASEGRIERRKRGAALVWRTPEPPAAPEPAQCDPVAVEPKAHVEALVDTIKRLAATLGVPLALLAPPSDERAADLSDVLAKLAQADPDQPDLGHLHEAILKRAIRRAAYDMGKALLDVLSGWVEGNVSNHDAMHEGTHDAEDCAETFTASDIRRMVNDAARIMGAPEPYAPEVATDAAS